MPIPSNTLISEYGVVPKDVYRSIVLDKTTRGDLVLLIGGPDRIYKKERVFVYEWMASEGMVGSVGGSGTDVFIKHFFCIEFDKDNKIIRFKHIESGIVDSVYKQHREVEDELQEWISISNP